MSLISRMNPVAEALPTIVAADEEAMDRLGIRLAEALETGDVVTVSGALGAGKSHLCRALIRARLGDPAAEVPSPSYTLVNIYRTPDSTEIWHADLYRIADPEELREIGLDEAAERGIVLIEWPDRWSDQPARRLDLSIEVRSDEARLVRAAAHGGGWGRLRVIWERVDDT